MQYWMSDREPMLRENSERVGTYQLELLTCWNISEKLIRLYITKKVWAEYCNEIKKETLMLIKVSGLLCLKAGQ